MPDERQEETPSRPRVRDWTPLYVPAAIVIAGILIGGGLFLGLSRTGGSGAPVAKAVNIKDVNIDGNPYVGKQDAPVVLAFWADYQCPFCRAVEIGHPQIQTPPAVPDLIKQYVDTGKLKIVFKDYPFLGEDSITDGEYARAVWDLYKSQYFAFRSALYEAQDEEGDQGFGDAASVDKLIKNKFPQFDLGKIKEAVATNKAKYDSAMTADRDEGTKFGIQGTPGFITGKTLIDGAQPLSAFVSAIDAQLK
ncbi:MAG: hypothetical protein RLZZ416_237 [Candidatus Parcubacteria bacterium]|jgi:protein-disulfide isomerase